MIQFEIGEYPFDGQVFDRLSGDRFLSEYWPVVYFLSDEDSKDAYVGETTDGMSRFGSHLRSSAKKQLRCLHIVTSERFNKSATLDIESSLIRYFSSDGKYKLLNGNLGIAEHNYFERREVYSHLFREIWDRFRSMGVAVHSLDHIDNSDLFKYSPYKALGREQLQGLQHILEGLLNPSSKTLLMEGGAGTGKTILAVFAFKLLRSGLGGIHFGEFGAEQDRFRDLVLRLKERYPDPKMALVVPMSSFRNTLKKVFKQVKDLSADMVVGPAELAKGRYDIVFVDEAHRLRQRVNLGAYYGAFDQACERMGLDPKASHELDWVLCQADKSVLFYDRDQSVKPSDVPASAFQELRDRKSTLNGVLRSQFRVRGGTDYVRFVDDLLQVKRLQGAGAWTSGSYELLHFEHLGDMVQAIKGKEAECGLSRMVAGYAWEWISKKDRTLFDIVVGDVRLQWNRVADDWINSSSAVDEVGCIHTTQGYDLNYAGIIFGREIGYDPERREIIIHPHNYFDRNGKQSIRDPELLKAYILNIYKTILLRGIRGTFVYACDPDLREYLRTQIPCHGVNTVAHLPEVDTEPLVPWKNAVPLFDARVAAGPFGEEEEVGSGEWVRLPSRYKASEGYFAFRVTGASMDKVIPDGAICLFRKYAGGSRQGRIVLVELIDRQDPDSRSAFTVKEYHRIQGKDGEGETLVLRPLSTDPSYEDMVFDREAGDDLKVIAFFECVLPWSE